ncbi:mycofactocin system transcriptional regulator [Herbiconiux sp. L3-i23]|uniref:mycofactocin system transcriptional regulator n=1 Tax=Herbiconiux sp. L3-i23 TaxID=2905871 RepID=UPI0020694317|nr:mycofactocin system transcriptional regulator [Herbiconiux sp. L3-i23]BDI22515.1 mycofactocin system transcriptional regulator [Herbiconiux sp. L3-i23]
MSEADPSVPRPRTGRQRSTTVTELSHIGLALFIENGFDATTVDDIATAAGIGRRTFFRYFSSKNDLPWGEFEDLLDSMRDYLASVPPEVPLIDALHAAVIEFNAFPDEEIEYHRQRMTLLLNVPSLVAHSTLRYASWRQVIAEYAAERLGLSADDLEPQTLGWALLSLSLSAYEQWLRHDDADLATLIDAAFAVFERHQLRRD